MCTYLYAAFSLRSGVGEGLSTAEAEAVERWRRVILNVATDEMGHLTAVWNITAALAVRHGLGAGTFHSTPAVCRPASWSSSRRSTMRCCNISFTWSATGFARAGRRGLCAGVRIQAWYAQAAPDADGVDYDTVGAFYRR